MDLQRCEKKKLGFVVGFKSKNGCFFQNSEY